MRSGILRARVAALRLNPAAPFPSQLMGRATLYLVGHKPKARTQWRGFAGGGFGGICPISQRPKLYSVK
jgi:hypothetical protein